MKTNQMKVFEYISENLMSIYDSISEENSNAACLKIGMLHGFLDKLHGILEFQEGEDND